MERNFALYDSDIFYVTRFMEYFKKKKDFGFELLAFTRKESLEEYLQSHSLEILLLGDQADMADIANIANMANMAAERVKYIYQLADRQGNEPDHGWPMIHKYQAVQSVMNQIMADYRKRENVIRDSPDPKQMKIISVFSPVQNLEGSSLAWSVASQLSEQKKTLLVLLELLPVPVITPPGHQQQALTEFIYYLKENSNIILKMNSLLSYYNNLACLSGVTHGADVLALGKEDVRRWMEELRIHTDYQAIVFYLGCYTEAGIEIMNLSNTVLIEDIDTGYGKALLTEWTRQMERTGIDINRDKYIRVPLQAEAGGEHLPVTLSGLAQTFSWNYAKEKLNSF